MTSSGISQVLKKKEISLLWAAVPHVMFIMKVTAVNYDSREQISNFGFFFLKKYQ